MCLSKSPKAPAQEDPAVTQARIEAEATKKSNAKIADRKRNNRGSLLSTGAGYTDQASISNGTSIDGKTTFG